MFGALIACLLLIVASGMLVLAAVIRASRLDWERRERKITLTRGIRSVEFPMGSIAQEMLPRRINLRA